MNNLKLKVDMNKEEQQDNMSKEQKLVLIVQWIEDKEELEKKAQLAK